MREVIPQLKSRHGSSGSLVWSTAVLLGIFLLGVTAPVLVSAHAPSTMQLEYDSSSQTLQVTLTHDVSDVTTHYVYRIQITINGADIITKEYEGQPTDSQFTYTFQIPVSPGDVIEVTAECNLGGSITERLEVGTTRTTAAETEVPKLWPLHAGFMVTGLFLMIVAVANVVNKTPKRWWLKAHKAVGVLSIALVITGLVLAFYMVSQLGGGHLRVPHAYVGVLTLLFSILSPFLGFTTLTWKAHRRPLRTTHVWVSRITVGLLVITLVSGLLQAGVL